MALNFNASFAKDVWKGMSEGVERGKAFRVKGTNSAIKAIKEVDHNAKKTVTKTVPKGTNIKKPTKVKATNYKASPKKVKLGARPKDNPNLYGKASFGQKTGDFLGGGVRDTFNNMNKKDMKFGEALKTAHRTPDGKLNMKRVAGTYVTASAVGRVASGGGITKDKNGNSNLIGIPFI